MLQLFRISSRRNRKEALPLTSDPELLGPFFGSLPPEVLSLSLLPKLDHLSRGLFALAAGACWRAVRDAGLSNAVDARSLCEVAAVGGHES